MEELSAERTRWLVTQKAEASPPARLLHLWFDIYTSTKEEEAQEQRLPVIYAIVLACAVFMLANAYGQWHKARYISLVITDLSIGRLASIVIWTIV